MDFHIHSSSSSRAEAERWLGIAEKLLAGRDLIGSKTFAIRARDSEPRLEAADQILAVVDTLIAGEKRINSQHDWYAILQLARYTRDSELIATQYRQLAFLLNPSRNHLAFADHAMKLVSDAWSVLSDPSRKFYYDNDLVLYSKLDLAMSPEESEMPNNHDENSTFWTACPYCYHMYEYPGVYVDCSLRCQNCRRAFHGTKIPAPPSIAEGKGAYFSCWGFFPVAVSNLGENKSAVSSWTPFSPLFTLPQFGDGNMDTAGQGNANAGTKKSPTPQVNIDDDDLFMEISSSSDESDDEWRRVPRKKKTKRKNGRPGRRGRPPKNSTRSIGDDGQDGPVMQEVIGGPNVPIAETSRKTAANKWGKLDLNVEFSNEVEEPPLDMRDGNGPNGAGNGEEDGIEGIGFFEGLDEFLNSLPILNVPRG
ncbi:hypothetical protein NMG60_11019028 [Bertholletia excelsa]